MLCKCSLCVFCGCRVIVEQLYSITPPYHQSITANMTNIWPRLPGFEPYSTGQPELARTQAIINLLANSLVLPPWLAWVIWPQTGQYLGTDTDLHVLGGYCQFASAATNPQWLFSPFAGPVGQNLSCLEPLELS